MSVEGGLNPDFLDLLEVEATRAGDETAARLARASAALCLPFELS